LIINQTPLVKIQVWSLKIQKQAKKTRIRIKSLKKQHINKNGDDLMNYYFIWSKSYFTYL
jgi:hypothetical protein